MGGSSSWGHVDGYRSRYLDDGKGKEVYNDEDDDTTAEVKAGETPLHIIPGLGTRTPYPDAGFTHEGVTFVIHGCHVPRGTTPTRLNLASYIASALMSTTG